MGIFSFVSRLFHTKYIRFGRINEFYIARDGQAKFNKLIKEHLNGKKLDIEYDGYFFSPHNPIAFSQSVMHWVVERQRAAFRYLDKNPPKTILETGCGFGASCWILKEAIPDVVGLDISHSAITVARTLFPEVKFECMDVKTYFEQNPNVHFDVILDCFGPINPQKQDIVDLVMGHCDILIKIGSRPKKSELGVAEYLKWKNKLPGYHLSFNSSVFGKDRTGLSVWYFAHYFTWAYIREFMNAVQKRKQLYIPF